MSSELRWREKENVQKKYWWPTFVILTIPPNAACQVDPGGWGLRYEAPQASNTVQAAASGGFWRFLAVASVSGLHGVQRWRRWGWIKAGQHQMLCLCSSSHTVHILHYAGARVKSEFTQEIFPIEALKGRTECNKQGCQLSCFLHMDSYM